MVVLGAQRQATMENDKLECFPRLSDISNVNESTTSEFSTINANDIKALGLQVNIPGYTFTRITSRE